MQANVSTKTSTSKFQGQTGPKSQVGKNHTRFNALKHGRNAKSKVLPYESEKEYKALVKAVFQDLCPEGAIEEDLAMQVVDSMWKRYRMEEKIRISHQELFDHLDHVKMANLLEVPEKYIPYAPEYLLNMSCRIGPAQTEHAQYAWQQYEAMMKDYESGGLTELQEMADHFTTFFEYVEHWFKNTHQLYSLYDPTENKVHPKWVQQKEHFFEVVEPIGAMLFYQAHFMGWKDQIRNWMQTWYLAQKSELREVDQYELVVIKQVHLTQNLLDKLMKLQKHKADIWVRLGSLPAWQEKILITLEKGAKLQNEIKNTV
jgi:hypothetical protein